MAQEGSLGDAVSAVCDAAGATRFAEGFMARWTRPRTRGDGCRPDETTAAEQRLGFPLPDALTACYRLLGRRDLTSRQDPLLPPDRLWVEDDVLVFRVENQHCALWGVPVPHLGEADPPVVFQNVAHTRPTGWRPFLDRFSSATVEMVLSEALLYGGGTEGDVNDNRELDEKTLRAVEDRFDRIPFPDHPLGRIRTGTPSGGSPATACCCGTTPGSGSGSAPAAPRGSTRSGRRCPATGSRGRTEAPRPEIAAARGPVRGRRPPAAPSSWATGPRAVPVELRVPPSAVVLACHSARGGNWRVPSSTTNSLLRHVRKACRRRQFSVMN